MIRTVCGSMLEFAVDPQGAQLISLTRNGKEFICTGTKFWNYSAPTLFPIVGRLNNDTLRYAGKSYSLGQHGFARTRHFVCIDDRPLTFRLAYDDDTLKVYPFKFALTVSFQPFNNELIITSRVINLDDDLIWFSIGSHPALNVPFDGGRFEDYRLVFNRDTSATRLKLSNGLLTHERFHAFDDGQLKLSYDLFNDDALIFDNLKSNCILIRRDSRSVGIRADCPFWGIWTKPGAPFLCIEPWHGHADFNDFNDDFSKKDAIISLEPGKSFSAQYSIIVDA